VIVDEVEQIVANAMAEDARPRALHICLDEKQPHPAAHGPRNARIARRRLARVSAPVIGPQRIRAQDQNAALVDPDEAMIEQVRRMLAAASAASGSSRYRMSWNGMARGRDCRGDTSGISIS
jgi:hypothetical protein